MADDEKPPHLRLWDFTEAELLEEKIWNHYQLLGVPDYASSDDIKKAFRKASLRYHPDKIAHDETKGEYVFLAIRTAHDTLMDVAKRQAYDSTVLEFDDSIPPERNKLLTDETLLYKDDDFYSLYEPVFHRNLRYDARLRPQPNNKKKTKSAQAPPLGDSATPLDQVHAFYDYWIHFESWRDFSQQATDELQVEQELENAESRFEKRWIQKEIDKRAKQLKKKEMSRIQLLVERAMESDPRLRAERHAQLQAKEEAQKERERQAIQAKVAAAREAQEAVEKEQVEKERLAAEKVEREKAKKELRKAKQQLRRMASSSFEQSDEKVWADSYDMGLDVEYLCTNLSIHQIRNLSGAMEAHDSAEDMLKLLKQKAIDVRNGVAVDETPKEDIPPPKQSTPEPNSNQRPPWTKDELSALAKAVRKYPPGGSSRWEQIALFVNNLCQQDEPRSKEECIDKYNNIARSSKPQTTSTPEQSSTDEDTWTPEEDQQLQDALSKYPASMEKNERWSSIAGDIPGKTKKQCVQRFKAIREALKNKK